MTWLAPWWLAAGAAAALAVVALHLLAWRRPPAVTLPTARFVPEAPARARSRASRPVDVALLALRVLALLLLAAAMARPVRTPGRAPLARVVVADLSASSASADAVRAAVASAWRAGDALVVMDTSVRALGAPDSLPARLASRAGRLSPALVLAGDAARLVAERADSAELVLASPLLREELDAATRALAAAWPGRVRHVPVMPAAPGDSAAAVQVESSGDDPVAAAAAAMGLRSRAMVRLVRRATTAAESAWVADAAGRVLVAWPAVDAPPDARDAGLAWRDDALVAPIAPDTAADAPHTGTAIVRWADGGVAATERALGAGCVRTVHVALPRAGDATLAPAFGRLLAYLAAPCGGPRDVAPVAAADLGFRVSGAARALARPGTRAPWAIARWLLAGALALLLVEPLLRRGATRDSGSGASAAEGDAERAAA